MCKISIESHQVGRTHIEPYMTNGRLLLFSFLIVLAAITTAVYSIIYIYNLFIIANLKSYSLY